MTNINQYIKSKKIYQAVIVSSLLMVMSACGGPSSSDGTVINTLDVPQDTQFTRYCPNVGIGAEDCILDDPENDFYTPALDTTITFALDTQYADNPKARFYLWGTAQANSPQGLYQYQTANALHQLYTVSQSELAKNQALKAYCEVFKSYFDSVWFQQDTFPGGVLAPVTVPRRLSELSAKAINGGSDNDDDDDKDSDLRAFFDTADAGLNGYHARNYMGGKECGGFTYDPSVGGFGLLTKN